MADLGSCRACGHKHQGKKLAFICIGCACPETPGKHGRPGNVITLADLGAPAWLDQPILGRDVPDELAAPFRLVADGAEWAAMCNRHVLLGVQATTTLPEAPASITPDLFAIPTDGVREIEGARLVDWLARHLSPLPCSMCGGNFHRPCAPCGGLGAVSCTCSTCEHEHEAQCEPCEGRGSEVCACVRPRIRQPGWVADALIDRNLLAPFVRHLAMPDVVRYATSGPVTPVRFWTDQWRAVVMPMQATSADASCESLTQVGA